MGPHYVLGLKATLSMIKCGHHVDGYTLPARLENQAQSDVVTMWMGTHYVLGLKATLSTIKCVHHVDGYRLHARLESQARSKEVKHNKVWSCGWVHIMC